MSDEQLQTCRKSDRALVIGSKVISWLFTPFLIPLLAFVAMFLFSYLRIMPLQYKLIVGNIVFVFTILIPVLMILLYKWIGKIKMYELGTREKRYMPFMLTIISYCSCLFMMWRLNIPWFMTAIILAALVIQVMCVLINIRWKLSEHMAGAGCIIGGLAVFSSLFGYNPLPWLCVFILIAGCLGSARIILHHHTLGEVLGGFALGFFTAWTILNPTNLIFRLFI